MGEDDYSEFMVAFREMVYNKVIIKLEWAYKTAGQPFQEDNWRDQIIHNYDPNQYDDKEIQEILGDNSMENMCEVVHYMYESGYKQFSMPLYYFWREFERSSVIDMISEGIFDEEIENIKNKMTN